MHHLLNSSRNMHRRHAITTSLSIKRKPIRGRHQSSSSNEASKVGEDFCAKDIAQIVTSGNEKKLARILSQEVRHEISLLQKKLGSNESNLKPPQTPEPSTKTLQMHALYQGIPFIGFGIMDNAILIWAGDAIDTHLGALLGISTLCAAAIGNIISDVAGIGLGATIEDYCVKYIKMPMPVLTHAQRQLRSVRFAGQTGNVVGITVGCIIGMFPLYFIDSKDEKLTNEVESNAS